MRESVCLGEREGSQILYFALDTGDQIVASEMNLLFLFVFIYNSTSTDATRATEALSQKASTTANA